MNLISTQKIGKSFAGKTLFQNLSMGVEESDRVGLVGPNGAGKSTLLKILTGKLSPDSGQVTSKKGLRIGYLEQSPHFNDEETILSAILSKCADATESLYVAYEWIAKLELTHFGEDFLVKDLSGGWRKRVALARELVLEPEILMLDEPTNHLDVGGIMWLEDFLERAQFAVLMITHDRLFLQRTCNKIFDLDPKNPNYLFTVSGGYLDYVEAKAQMLEAQDQKEQVLKNTLRRETEWLRRGAKARQTKQKSRIERALQLKEDVSDLSEKNNRRRVNIEFKESERAPQKLMALENVTKGYEGRCLFENFSFLVTPKTRLAILGENGSGKSSLLRIFTGEEKPDLGTVFHADRLKLAYFEQNRQTLKPELSVLKNICPDGDYVSYQGQFIYARSYLERFLFQRQQMDLPVEKLSGGEQSRLRIAQLMLSEAQVLILDEPTNDLDSATLSVLEESLRDFKGAVILVTHDRYFMDQVANQILAFHRSTDGVPMLQTFAEFIQWEEWFLGVRDKEFSDSSKGSNLGKETTEKSSLPVKLSYKEKYELENMESTILTIEQKLAALQVEAEDPQVVSQASKVQGIYTEITDLQTKLEELYARWAELESKAKGS